MIFFQIQPNAWINVPGIIVKWSQYGMVPYHSIHNKRQYHRISRYQQVMLKPKKGALSPSLSTTIHHAWHTHHSLPAPIRPHIVQHGRWKVGRRCRAQWHRSHAKGPTTQVERAVVRDDICYGILDEGIYLCLGFTRRFHFFGSQFPEVTHKVYLDVGEHTPRISFESTSKSKCTSMIFNMLPPLVLRYVKLTFHANDSHWYEVIEEEKPIRGRITIGLFGKTVRV